MLQGNDKKSVILLQGGRCFVRLGFVIEWFLSLISSEPNKMTKETLSKPNLIMPSDLADFCDDYLKADEFDDYCPNGLQVDADTPISRVVTGVTACQALIDEAVARQAQLILVHHGYFWKGESAPLVGMKGKRIRTLLQNNLSLLAYHLPLDAHPVIGNNAVLAKALRLDITGALYPNEKHPVGNIAECQAISSAAFAQKINQVLGRPPLHLSDDPNRLLTKIAICTGGAQDMIEQAYHMGCQAFISGEASERTTHLSRELGVDYFGAGHHATERGGVRALGEHLAEEFGLDVVFVDVDNPV